MRKPTRENEEEIQNNDGKGKIKIHFKLQDIHGIGVYLIKRLIIRLDKII